MLVPANGRSEAGTLSPWGGPAKQIPPEELSSGNVFPFSGAVPKSICLHGEGPDRIPITAQYFGRMGALDFPLELASYRAGEEVWS